MLGRIFIALCRLPGFKKRLWRAWYDYLAGSRRAPAWTFMNYGYAEPSARARVLAEEDEHDRHWIQLYDHVAGAVDLERCTVLEVGSGRGGGSSFMRRYMRPARMTGVDLSRKAVELSRSIHRIDGLDFGVADAENLPFEDASFDAVVNVESSHCYPSFEKFLFEVQRVLRPGGYFLYADFRERARLNEWHQALRSCKLAVLRECDITSNVLTALDLDNDRKRELIDQLIPRVLRSSFLDFAAVRGSALFEAFRSGKLVYVSFVLRKP
jgi:SAM-dependent methyltransferase